MTTPQKSTHWSTHNDPEEWEDNPAPTPQEAVTGRLGSKDCDDAWHWRDDIAKGNPVDIDVHGYEATRDAPKYGECWEYEPGIEWFRPTGEKRTVRVTLAMEVMP